MPQDPQLFRRCDIARICGVSLQTVDRMRRRGLLPDPVWVAPRIPAWESADVMAAIKRMQVGAQLPLSEIDQ